MVEARSEVRRTPSVAMGEDGGPGFPDVAHQNRMFENSPRAGSLGALGGREKLVPICKGAPWACGRGWTESMRARVLVLRTCEAF